MNFSQWRGVRPALPLVAAAGVAASMMAAIGPSAGAGAAVRPATTGMTVARDTAPARGAVAPGPAGSRSSAAGGGPYVTLLFSRSEITAADNCTADNSGVANLETVVAPYLSSLRMTGTGTIVTGKTRKSAELCTHHNQSLAVSWDDAHTLANFFHWSFGSATATYPANISKLSNAQQYQETCGSAATLDSEGLPGAHGIIDYPGLQQPPTEIQSTYGAECFAWGRLYAKSGTTDSSAGTTPPYWQNTRALNGGDCNDPAASCYTVPSYLGAGHGLPRYTTPDQIIALVNELRPGQWLSLQSYILVTGTSPPYTSNKDQWNCTSSNPDLHWSNDNERYCYSDFQQIVQAIAHRGGITVTDPLTVGIAFGRPATYESPAQVRPAS
jgi:hypothetical protein